MRLHWLPLAPFDEVLDECIAGCTFCPRHRCSMYRLVRRVLSTHRDLVDCRALHRHRAIDARTGTRRSVPVDDVFPWINDGQVVSSPAFPLPCSARSHEARRTGVPSRLGAREFAVSAPNPSIARKPAWMLDFALEICRQLESRPDGMFPPELNATLLPPDLPSN
jgi:hypothetical protein